MDDTRTNAANLRVYWYDDPEEAEALVADYRQFVLRCGNRPTLPIVEQNIVEITRRILCREHALCAKLQARWRGWMARITTRQLYFEQCQMRALHHAMAVVIQRLYRAHVDTHQVRRVRQETWQHYWLGQYTLEQVRTAREAQVRATRAKAGLAYVQYFQHQRSMKVLAGGGGRRRSLNRSTRSSPTGVVAQESPGPSSKIKLQPLLLKIDRDFLTASALASSSSTIVGLKKTGKKKMMLADFPRPARKYSRSVMALYDNQLNSKTLSVGNTRHCDDDETDRQ